MLNDPVLSDDLIIRLVQVQYDLDTKLDIMEEAGVDLSALRPDLLAIAMDAFGVPPEKEGADPSDIKGRAIVIPEDATEEEVCELTKEIVADDEYNDKVQRDWIYTLYNATLKTGSYEEVQLFLAEVREGLQERGLEQSGA